MPEYRVVPMVAECGEVCPVCQAHAYANSPGEGAAPWTITHAPMCQQVFELQTLLKNHSTVTDELIQGLDRLQLIVEGFAKSVEDQHAEIRDLQQRLDELEKDRDA